MADVFEKRIRRAETLLREWEFATQILSFFTPIAEIQSKLFSSSNPEEKTKLHSQLWEHVCTRGPAALAERAKQMMPGDLLGIGLSIVSWIDPPTDPAGKFFTQVLAQVEFAGPLTKELHDSHRADETGSCPLCTLSPIVSVLREDKQAETVRRTLLCPRCCNEWDFPRVLCPSCKEERPEKLPRLTAQEIPWMRVEACDSCHQYIKSVDLTLNWEAEPVVDELASTPLDVIAREHGYTKIAPNLAGI